MRLRSLLYSIGLVLVWVSTVWAIDFGGEVAVNIDTLLIGVAVAIVALIGLWLKYGVKKGLKKLGLENVYPLLEPYIDNFIFQAEERSRQLVKNQQIGLTGEQKLTMVTERINEFTKKIGVDLDRPEVVGWINGRVAYLRDKGLEKAKEELAKHEPPVE